MVLYKELSYKLVGCAMEVHSQLGAGLVEQCYDNALYFELREAGFSVIELPCRLSAQFSEQQA